MLIAYLFLKFKMVNLGSFYFSTSYVIYLVLFNAYVSFYGILT